MHCGRCRLARMQQSGRNSRFEARARIRWRSIPKQRSVQSHRCTSSRMSNGCCSVSKGPPGSGTRVQRPVISGARTGGACREREATPMRLGPFTFAGRSSDETGSEKTNWLGEAASDCKVCCHIGKIRGKRILPLSILYFRSASSRRRAHLEAEEQHQRLGASMHRA